MPYNWRGESRTLSTSAFEKATDPQIDCRLIQLPPELRFEILRILHLAPDKTIYRHGNTRTSKEEPTLEANYEKNTQLSSQLFRCCQLLLFDASYVLYEENKLEIQYKVRLDKSLDSKEGRFILQRVAIYATFPSPGCESFHQFP